MDVQDTQIQKKTAALVALAALVLGGVVATSEAMPERTPQQRGSSDVHFKGLSIPGKQCSEGPGFTADAPKWKCGDTSVRSNSGTVKEDADLAMVVARQHRFFRGDSELPVALAKERSSGLWVLDDGERVTVAARKAGAGNATVCGLHFDGPHSRALADNVVKEDK
ncbi:hypothetical protein H0194_05995 [Corynebacterium incognita]|uniref:Uncharacterized protein n=1 Tax=Corynebacterium incognita TaxID=2754725 RepID=A0A7G7CM47_9CORY|nr:hypothetical protein [Corynebacterium incognita]QNE88663.1 hypothetical protein H0194_05995 [Corynebacterium incognita]